ncbi:MAG TPA: gliding motility-associated C-terminal domain-containing protein [Ferruginibacter sp.]|nr:gliding motility-associated C-terminal domain-containing protein [Ferruginibacter sp.]HMP19601.1 gliding motility-associated C-terminal domain-containing protein [Ferruginibacter sp.]
MKIFIVALRLKYLPAFCLFSILFTHTLHAQICSGSLGDPVVNVTFGTGPNPGAALPSRVIAYNYTAGQCPDDGFYTVANSTAGCFGNTWHALAQDHTPGDNNGYMLLINASFTPGDFYIDTVKNLCPGTTYEFAAWILNLLRNTACSPNRINPNIVFNIETPSGTVLGTYSTGDIPSTAAPEWKQYGLFFTTPVGSNTVVIRMRNNAPGGCGNDLALDDITFRPCGPLVNTSVTSNSKSITFCANDVQPVTLSATIGSGYISPALQWQQSLNNGSTWADIPAATNNSYTATPSAAGTYLYRLAVAQGGSINVGNCRVISIPDTIIIRNIPAVAISSNSPVCNNENIELLAGGGSTYQWTGPSGFTSTFANVQLAANEAATAGQYTVQVTDIFGCRAIASTMVQVLPKPNATVSGNTTICRDSSTTLEAGGGSTYLWFPSTGLTNINSASTLAQPITTTTYSVIVTDNNGCADTASTIISVSESPVADAGPDVFMLSGETVTLRGNATGNNINYYWEPAAFLSDAGSLMPVTNTPQTQEYVLYVVSATGCGTATDTMLVKVFNGLYIPTAFSPNGDGLNDTWRIDGLLAYPKAVIAVYNRFGQIVFEGSANSSWDGRIKNQPAAAGTYVYYINLNNGRPVIKGSVVLVR